MDIIMMKTTDIIKNPNNPRIIKDDKFAKLVQSVKDFPEMLSIRPVVVNAEMVILGGNMRFEACKKAGIKEIPVIIADNLTEEQQREVIIKDNVSGGEWDWDQLANEWNIDNLNAWGLDLWECGGVEDSGDFLESVSGELPGAMALKEEMVFPSDAIYNIPELLPEMIIDIPDDISCWCGSDASNVSNFYLYNYSTDSTKGLDFSKTISAFYTDDARFECFWQKPAEYTGRLINRGIIGTVTPNYSLWFHSPEALKIWNTYRSRWVGRYFQEAGIPIIPDINFSSPTSFDYCFAGVPVGCKAISIQIQTGKKSIMEITGKRNGIKKAIETIKPKSILLYVGDDYEKITDGIIPAAWMQVPIAPRCTASPWSRLTP